MKKFFVAFFCCFFVASIVYGQTVTIKNQSPVQGTIYVKGTTMDTYTLFYNKNVTPFIIEIDGVDYQAISIDVFHNEIPDGNYDAMFSCPSTYSNRDYVDPINSLSFALYNLNVNWDDSRNFTMVQLMFWDTLYDYQPSENQHIDKNFMSWDLFDVSGNDLTEDKQAYVTPYQNFLLNSISNNSFSINGLFDNYTIVTITIDNNKMCFLIKRPYIDEKLFQCPEPEVIFVDKIIEVPLEITDTYIKLTDVVEIDGKIQGVININGTDIIIELPDGFCCGNHDNGHGNDQDGYDESNPGKSNGCHNCNRKYRRHNCNRKYKN